MNCSSFNSCHIPSHSEVKYPKKQRTENCRIQALVFLPPRLYPFHVFGVLLGFEQMPSLIVSKF